MTKKLSGFTFIKNGLTLGYPIRESVESIAPLCDEVVINVGFDNKQLSGDDGTYEYLRDSFPENKYKFIKNWWDPQLTSKGKILAQQTNLALEQCTGDFCQYIQGDEALHEDDFDNILRSIERLKERKDIDSLIYNYLHFYGNVDAILYTRRMYRREVRLIRNGLGAQSHLDAQGFRFGDNSKLTGTRVDATVYHYGWARKEQVMEKKIVEMDKLYHEDPDSSTEDFKFKYKRGWGIRKFTQTHPKVMQEWINQHKNDLDIHGLKLDFKFKDIGLVIADGIEAVTGHRVGEYKNYKLIK